ncbi:hypothetical protein SteCoe_32607 [Stentor coeruleus]|uniref:RING-type domain-containing protein n=1 Tax=Stentor coeruleus TaxID=5963 RepID=A0A1R2AYR2_9CILI|nr:hypothetical protein SteCoe_32607 [Stentor coeruleus]
MNQNMLDLNAFAEIAPSLPRQYLKYAYNQCMFYKNDDIIDCFLYLERHYLDSLGELYKVFNCPILFCEYYNCPFYHSISDQRRNLYEISYMPKPCYSVYKYGLWDYSYKCPWGNNCHFAHSSYEMKFHPENIGLIKISEEDLKIEERNSMTFNQIALQISEYKEEIRRMAIDIEDKQKILYKVNLEIQELKVLSMCMLCKKEVYDFVLKCGHLCCKKCKETFNGECFGCNQQV